MLPESPNPLVSEIRALKRDKQDEAHKLLRQCAGMVSKIMEARSWKVLMLREFFPKNANLLGLNVNRGQEVRIRLRPANDPENFYSFEFVLGTMLHELVHNVHGPHDVKFYALLDVIRKECEDWMYKGFTGLKGFDAGGKKLGGNRWTNPSDAERHRVMELAATKRRRDTPYFNGRRLGGSSPLGSNKSPRELAVLAAEKRRRDNLWCGDANTIDVDDLDSTEPTSSTSSGERTVNGASSIANNSSTVTITARHPPENGHTLNGRNMGKFRRDMNSLNGGQRIGITSDNRVSGNIRVRVSVRSKTGKENGASGSEVIEILDSDDDEVSSETRTSTRTYYQEGISGTDGKGRTHTTGLTRAKPSHTGQAIRTGIVPTTRRNGENNNTQSRRANALGNSKVNEIAAVWKCVYCTHANKLTQHSTSSPAICSNCGIKDTVVPSLHVKDEIRKIGVPTADPKKGIGPQGASRSDTIRWICEHCTFANTDVQSTGGDTNVCSMCALPQM